MQMYLTLGNICGCMCSHNDTLPSKHVIEPVILMLVLSWLVQEDDWGDWPPELTLPVSVHVSVTIPDPLIVSVSVHISLAILDPLCTFAWKYPAIGASVCAHLADNTGPSDNVSACACLFSTTWPLNCVGACACFPDNAETSDCDCI